jgi:uncharacterized protein
MSAKEEKEKRLEEILKEMNGVVVAFSGGVDSTYLLAKAREVIKNNVIAVTAISPLHPLREIEEAKERANLLKVEHVLLESKELENAEFRSNPPHRCYLCRKMLYGHFRELARQKNISHILNGSNKDDAEKARPGMRAALEHDVRSPLQEAGLLKREIRQLARKAGLSNWNKPALPCLATRFQYGEQLTLTKLEQVERSEDFLRSIGFEKLRVRYHGEIARLELEGSMMEEVMNRRKEIAIVLQKLGFTYVTLDLCSAMEEKE